MSEHEKSGINWGGLIKGIVAGAAILAGIHLVSPGLLLHLIPNVGAGAGASEAGTAVLSEIGSIIKPIAGVILATVGLSYLLSDGSKNENAERHAQQLAEAKESFAIREDMRKMQAVMMTRMKAAGHDPAMAAPQQGV